MTDDGINYIQHLWVVPENEIEQVQNAMANNPDFTGPGQ